MLNGINNNENILNSQLGRGEEVGKVNVNGARNPYDKIDKNLLIDESAISNEAVNLYQRELDVKQFAKLVCANPENTSHEEIMNKLFSKGVTDPFSDDAVSQLVNNRRFLEDLGL